KELRGFSKNAVSFGIVYGRHAAALALDFGWSIKKAQQFIDRYFAKYWGVLEYLEVRKEYIKKFCEVVSKFGRHRRLPEALHEEESKQAAAIREGINTDIQGDASDLSWIAAWRMERWLRENNMKSKVIVVVHDAVYVDAHRSEMKLVIPKLHFFMTDRTFLEAYTGWKMKIELDTDCSVGRNLGEMTELEHTKTPGKFVLPEKFTLPTAA
ncbi:MAG: hypothetical protein Q9190_008160, partial [Brigantiaea leucoxantha]